MDAPQVTTVIPVYNGQAYLQATLESVANQTRPPTRLIVLDDASTDNTLEIARRFTGLPCESIRNERNLGLFPNHNRALDFAAETDYLHILHANDLIRPAFYEQLLQPMTSVPGLAMAFSGYELIDDAGAMIGPVRSGPAGPARPVSLKSLLISQAELQPLLIDAVLLKTGRRPAPCNFPLDFPQLGDVLFHANWATHCDAWFETREPLCQFRQHRSGATRSNITQLHAWVLDEWRAMERIASLIDDPPVARRIRHQKLRCLFAARCHVKIAQTSRSDADYARQIKTHGLRIAGPACWWLGRCAVLLRDTIHAALRIQRLKPGGEV
jgi:glycosyltransferase involved in cell wall biosynthesis